MIHNPTDSVLTASWTYRSFRNLPDFDPKDPAKWKKGLLFGEATIELVEELPGLLWGTLGGEGWSLKIHGSVDYGDQTVVSMLGKGAVGGHPWVYAYIGYLVPDWPNGIDQATAMVGSTVRVIDHPGGDGTIHKAGEVASWYAVRQP